MAHEVRIPGLDPEAATGLARPLFDGVQAKRGYVPGLIRVLGHSPAALRGYLGFGTAMAGGVLGEALRERVAIAVAARNGCEPCRVTHRHRGRLAGLTEAELEAAEGFRAEDPAARAALDFAASLLDHGGAVPDEALAAVRAAGFDEAAVIELACEVFINQLTNAVNHLAGTPPDDLAARLE